jgi:hypothetical protein
MRAFLIAPYYIHWHYSRALKGIVVITGNLMWFCWHFFSVGLLLETLFSPWQRIQEQHKRGLDIEGYLSTVTVNLVMRCVGIFIRSIFIVLGLASIVLVGIGGLAVFAMWLVLPAAIIFAFILGFILLFKPL